MLYRESVTEGKVWSGKSNNSTGDSYGLDHGAHIGGAEDGQNFCAF